MGSGLRHRAQRLGLGLVRLLKLLHATGFKPKYSMLGLTRSGVRVSSLTVKYEIMEVGTKGQDK